MPVEKAARIVADRLISYFEFPDERRDVVAFGVTTVFLWAIDVLGIVVVGSLIGLPGQTLAAAASFAGFRLLTGGAHFTGPWLCCTASSVLLAGCALLAGWLTGAVSPLRHVGLVAGIALIAAATFSAYAPVASSAKPLSDERKASLKHKALLVTAVWVMAAVGGILADKSLWVLSSALGLISQVITVTPGGARLFHLVDHAVELLWLNKVKGGADDEEVLRDPRDDNSDPGGV
jgi:accessory gene regulator B